MGRARHSWTAVKSRQTGLLQVFWRCIPARAFFFQQSGCLRLAGPWEQERLTGSTDAPCPCSDCCRFPEIPLFFYFPNAPSVCGELPKEHASKGSSSCVVVVPDPGTLNNRSKPPSPNPVPSLLFSQFCTAKHPSEPPGSKKLFDSRCWPFPLPAHCIARARSRSPKDQHCQSPRTSSTGSVPTSESLSPCSD